ncbi:o-succinylbenzoate synthase [Mastigocoleus sp. MO_188.B34]|uniref:o-succinylbenzoate synthase n=1 Tax=Mastigocoleus sp. MO_188.B34 TaxID=3036635 RepID=UPI0026048348|nr:o-succinylbenzoate synthase [Mastigocoleus sp. MO_188.B34]MDJ0695752.1 o-succinylbenzoate synthase [Mastigocoleus sp. MO_188.B34]
MLYRFEFRPYQRKFSIPLQTSHGMWDIRQGIILRLQDETDQIGWGEIAPIEWFGSESFPEALDFCKQLPNIISSELICGIPDKLPACQSGFESAWEIATGNWKPQAKYIDGLQKDFPSSCNQDLTYSALLPAGRQVLEKYLQLLEAGYRTFKWKIGVYPVIEEISILKVLARKLPADVKLRLDANGGLTYEETILWLKTCDRINSESEFPLTIEFIEQPLAPKNFEIMLDLSSSYTTPIALDESVATLRQLKACYEKGWREIFVVKPGIIGSRSQLRQFYQQNEIDIVFSSVFETIVGKEAALQIANELSRKKRALGFGIKHYFTDPEEDWLNNFW